MKKRNMMIAGMALCCLMGMGCLALVFRHINRPAAARSTVDREGSVIEQPMKRDGQILLRLADNQREDHPASVACDYFSELVEERTDGRIKIITYHSAKLGDEKSTISELHYGGIDMVRTSIALLTDYNPELVVLEMPYIYKDSDHMWKVLDSELGDYFLKSLEQRGMEGLCWFDAGARNFYTTGKPITRLKDLEGLYIRVQQSSFMVDLVSVLGANPVDLPYEAVATQLKQHRIDGAENNFSSYISAGHYLPAPYVVMDGHTRIPEMIVVNKRILEELDPEDQEIIRQAARETSVFQRELWRTEEEKAMKKVLEAGGQITFLEDQEALEQKVRPIYNTYVFRYRDLLERVQEIGGE